MKDPVGQPTLEIRSVTLAKTDPGDAVLEGKPLVDRLEQYVHASWPEKAGSDDALASVWAAEEQALETLDGEVPDDEDGRDGPLNPPQCVRKRVPCRR